MIEPKIRILLVEDEEHLLESIAFNLEQEGYEVRAVGDGINGIKIFKKEKV